MRYPAEQKAETHEKIVNAAAQWFRERGSQGGGIASLMQDLGLTHGGFYRQFESKEDLYVQAITRALQQAGDRMVGAAKAAPEGEELRAIIESYLSDEHAERIGQGCTIAALGPEIARQPPAVRTQVNVALKAHMNRLLPFAPGENRSEKRRNLFVLFSAMAGVLMMARTITEPAKRKERLDAARRFFTEAFAEQRR
jgi:TetR/AcrR family transcriptional repressor of nem operon